MNNIILCLTFFAFIQIHSFEAQLNLNESFICFQNSKVYSEKKGFSSTNFHGTYTMKGE